MYTHMLQFPTILLIKTNSKTWHAQVLMSENNGIH
jgi:hypothetical protein